MKYAEFNARLRSLIEARERTDPQRGMHVIRALGQLTHDHARLPHLLPIREEQLGRPFIAVVSSLAQYPAERRHQVFVGNAVDGSSLLVAHDALHVNNSGEYTDPATPSLSKSFVEKFPRFVRLVVPEIPALNPVDYIDSPHSYPPMVGRMPTMAPQFSEPYEYLG